MTETSAFPQGQILRVSGRGLVLRGDDIDTDRIIPARFLKCVSFDALGEQAFADDRTELAGDHPFDQEAHQGASILVVNDNFGCGSSREHAPQALMRWGIRAVIGVSFAEIFYGNCLALGIPCATAGVEDIRKLQDAVESDPAAEWTLDLESLTVSDGTTTQAMALAGGALDMLRSGQWDATGQLLARDLELSRTMAALPYLHGF
ncbi:3-isopropylmalate dehydratase small subunit 2 [Synechococcus sp. A15-60]|uniref:3-isopropylmalate dehydratase small subunit n=1 Tax=Synechococcus sp. A15-60 TaxID=1050655 RepID=UPI0016440D23|nr:3-isopropylmalate dehydratase small subunit [Synechococcus sp. A15-60]MEC7896656.1 3-isopropylmalate dehydratase small subunit [Cyanobacteriota bacterium]QNI47029.1 3-isopropylmalate dehydratase small subunit [Synechococcus sp. A15-60]|tara:strand:- start:3047 stop:3661 length:615 start_codon:yes stop_codon:yes gene_type:complete